MTPGSVGTSASHRPSSSRSISIENTTTALYHPGRQSHNQSEPTDRSFCATRPCCALPDCTRQGRDGGFGTWPRFHTMNVRVNSMIDVPFWLTPVVFTRTMPTLGRYFDSLVSSTSLRE